MKNTVAFMPQEYDKKIKQTLPYYEEFYKQIVNVIKSYYNRKVSWIDVGCGTGDIVRWGLELADRFVLCDSSPDMLNIAKKQVVSENTKFVLKSVQEMEYENEFDVVTAIQVFHYLTAGERKKAVSKCFDALKQEGIFITFENFAPDTEYGKKLYLERWMRYQTEYGRSEQESKAHILRYGKNYFPIKIDESKKLIKECGFKDVELLWCSYMQVGFIGFKRV